VHAGSAYAAPTVSIRIEGQSQTLVPRTTVTLDPAQIEGVDDECPGDTIAGALDQGTQGDWDHLSYTKTIMGETHEFNDNDSWSGWLGNTGKLSGGFCATQLQEGDEVIIMANFADPNDSYVWLYQPLFLRDVPQTVVAGEPFTVRVQEIATDRDQYGFEQAGSGRFVPAPGVTVASGGATATTGSDGVATLTLAEPGEYTLQARSGDGLDRSHPGTLRVLAPDEPPPPPPASPTVDPAPPCLHDGEDGRCGTRDLQAPSAFITSIREGATFARGQGPRELSGTAGLLGATGIVPDGTGILMIKLRLTRSVGPRCSTWSPSKERFVPRPCGAANGFWFKIGEEPDWEYLLPAGLRRGRYVLDADAIDRAGNRLRIRKRGENRVVFRVR
jgi:hypothetical protein